MARGVDSARRRESRPVGRAAISEQTIGLIVELVAGPALPHGTACAKVGELESRVANRPIEQAFLNGVIAGNRQVQRENKASQNVAATRDADSWEHVVTVPSLCELNSALAKSAITAILTKYEEFRSVTQLAQRLGCHPVHLARSFRTAIGVDVSAYLRTVKLGAAFRLVIETDLKMQSVSHVAGCGGKANLYRWMHLVTGHTPGFWRVAKGTDKAFSY